MHTFERQVLVGLPKVMGIDLSVTNEVLLLWLAAATAFVLLTVACRRKQLVAHGPLQNLFEALIEFIQKEIVTEGLGAEGRRWASFLIALFFFILFCNLLGMVPVPSHFTSVTANISVTVSLALIVFVMTLVINIHHNGFRGFLRKFVPDGVPRWVLVLIVPIEIASWLAKPVSLAVRLFANMLAGHALILAFVGLTATVAWIAKPLPLAGAVIMSAFELFVSFIQAFVFTMLAGFYIRDALETAH